MHNQVKSEQSFPVTSTKRVAIFQASLKLVRKEAGSQFSNKDNTHLTSHESKCLCEVGCCKK